MARTPEQFVQEMKTINPHIAIIGKYNKALERVRVKCLQCDNIWCPQAYSLLQGKGCPSCSAKRGAITNKGRTGLKTTEQFSRDLQSINDSIQVIGEYINGHSYIKLRCSRCDHIWEAKPYSVLQGHGCPRCSKSGTSFMEQFILLSFQEKLGPDKVLSRNKSAIGMELDIYIPDFNIAFEPGNWLLHRRSIARDIKKRELCQDKNIRLITIYDKYPIDKKPPFNENIYTFHDDLNNADHSILKRLVIDLLHSISIDSTFTDNVWNQIEKRAYENSKSMNHEIFEKRLQEVHPLIHIESKYQNANRRIRVSCSACGYSWDAVPSNLLSGDGCRKCGTKRAHEQFTKKHSDFVNELSLINPNIEIIGPYSGRHSSIRARCKICGYEWEPIASSLLRGSSHKGAISTHNKLQVHND